MQTCPACGRENPPGFRLCGFCGAQLAPALPPQEVRKTVSIVFSDLKGSTSLGEALDSESLREVMSSYFEVMSRELERHGGTIEKFIGDAVMAVFGLPTLHEDDALRAVRAAAGMQRALAGLNVELRRRWGVELTNRTGVNTGEVVAGDPTTGQRLITGDPVTTAARLEQAAAPNEILIGQLTYDLVRDAVEVEAVESLALKGKAEPVPAYRLIAVRDAVEGRARHDDAPMVGREAEIAGLRSLFDESVAQNGCRMATVIGEAGVGKSRLIREFVTSVEGRARVVRGRCLPYGEGITFWPFVEIARGAAEIREEDSPEIARTKLLTLVGESDVAARITSAAGLTPAQFPVAELFWGARRFMEILAASRPLVVIIDDIHWAERTFLDLLEHLFDNLVEAPVLVLCSARNELLEGHPDWAVRPGATRLILEPLSEADAAQIVENLLGYPGLPEEIRARIVAAGEGNPLFVEQMLSMLIDTGALRFHQDHWIRAAESEEMAVPPTIQALLAARLDRLDRDERAVIETASVIGLSFPEPAVRSLAPDAVRPRVPAHLGSLTRKQLIRPDAAAAGAGAGAEAGADEMYRFHHILVRDAAYNGLLKRARATLHERFVAWADRVNADRDRALEFEEILGYHLEQAYRYRSELGPLDEEGIRIGVDGGRRLAGAGRRAFARGDMNAAATMFRRAVGLLQDHDPNRLALLPELGEALMEIGEFENAETVLGEAMTAAGAVGNSRVVTSASLVRLLVRRHSADPSGWSEDALRAAQAAVPLLEAADANAELAMAWRLIAYVHGVACRYGETAQAAARSMEHARRAGDARMVARNATGLALAALYGPTPVPEAVLRCEQILADGLGDRQAEGLVLCSLAQLRAMEGSFELARADYVTARSMLHDLGGSVLAASTGMDLGRVELLAGAPAVAEREMRRDYETLDQMGETYLLASLAALLARAILRQGRVDEAEAVGHMAEDLAAEDDIEAQALWRSVRGQIECRRGRLEAAERLARRGLEIARTTDYLVLQAECLAELAEVLRRRGQEPAARAALQEAVGLYRLKGDLVSAAAMDALLRGLDAGSTAVS